MKPKPSARFSELAEAWLRLDGKPFRFDLYPMHRAFYDARFRRTLFKTGRQVAKSTSLANFNILECSVIPHFKTMYVSPQKEKTVIFSTTRVAKTMRYSPHISKRFLTSDLSDRVLQKQFTNGSTMHFMYADEDPERLRGISADRSMYDEVQDILYDPVIIIGNETMANSSYGFETYAGTPKTMENTIQSLWDLSTQSEWVMKCDACGKHQYVDSARSMGKEGIICLKCGAYLNPYTGQWIDFNQPKEMEYEPAFALHGFHISPLIMPANLPMACEKQGFASSIRERAHERWTRIVVKMNDPNYSETLFKNEVLGVSDSLGERMITKEELEALCTNRRMLATPRGEHAKGFMHIVGGVDWSGGGMDGTSRTVLWIWGFRPTDSKLVTLFYKIYPGMNPVNSINEIALICSAYNVSLVVGDAGGGAIANNLLQQKLGFHRVTQVQYGAPARALQFNGEDRYIANRTTVIDNYLMLLKNRKVEFGCIEEMGIAIEDILNEYEELTSSGKKVWRHSPQKSDDCLHAGVFGWIAHKIASGDLRFYQR